MEVLQVPSKGQQGLSRGVETRPAGVAEGAEGAGAQGHLLLHSERGQASLPCLQRQHHSKGPQAASSSDSRGYSTSGRSAWEKDAQKGDGAAIPEVLRRIWRCDAVWRSFSAAGLTRPCPVPTARCPWPRPPRSLMAAARPRLPPPPARRAPRDARPRPRPEPRAVAVRVFERRFRHFPCARHGASERESLG